MTTNNTSTTALPQKLRGTATVYNDLSFEFRPQGEGQPQHGKDRTYNLAVLIANQSAAKS